MTPRRIKVMSNGTESYFPVLLKRTTITHVGCSHRHWQSAKAEGRKMAKAELAERKELEKGKRK